MMKTIAILLLILTINACKGQDDKGIVTYPKNKEMNNTELFDVKGFKNYQTEQKKQGKINVLERIQDDNGTIIKEYSLTSSENGTEYARETQPPVPDLFYSLKIFDENGKIKNFTDQVFWGIFEFEFGKHYFYNKDGSLEKTVDYTKQFDDYKVKVDDLLKILTMENIRFENFDDETKQKLSSTWFENNKDITPEMIFNSVKKSFETNEESYGRFEQKILNPYNRTDVQRIHIDFNYQQKIWIVKKDFSSLGVVYFDIDANSKKIIKTNYQLY